MGGGKIKHQVIYHLVIYHFSFIWTFTIYSFTMYHLPGYWFWSFSNLLQRYYIFPVNVLSSFEKDLSFCENYQYFSTGCQFFHIEIEHWVAIYTIPVVYPLCRFLPFRPKQTALAQAWHLLSIPKKCRVYSTFSKILHFFLHMCIFFCNFAPQMEKIMYGVRCTMDQCTVYGVRRNLTPGEFYDRPPDARSSGALHSPREGANHQ